MRTFRSIATALVVVGLATSCTASPDPAALQAFDGWRLLRVNADFEVPAQAREIPKFVEGSELVVGTVLDLRPGRELVYGDGGHDGTFHTAFLDVRAVRSSAGIRPDGDGLIVVEVPAPPQIVTDPDAYDAAMFGNDRVLFVVSPGGPTLASSSRFLDEASVPNTWWRVLHPLGALRMDGLHTRAYGALTDHTVPAPVASTEDLFDELAPAYPNK